MTSPPPRPQGYESPPAVSPSTASLAASLPPPDEFGLTADTDMFNLYRSGQKDAVILALLRDLDTFKVRSGPLLLFAIGVALHVSRSVRCVCQGRRNDTTNQCESTGSMWFMSRSCPNDNAHGGCAIRLQESSAVLIQRLDRWMAMFVFLFTRKDLPITAVCPCSWQGGLLAYICLFVELYSCE